MSRLTLKPTKNQTFILLGYDFAATMARAEAQQAEGDFAGACNTRFQAFQQLAEVLPDQAVELDASHANTMAAMELILASAIDHLLVGDAEMAAAQLELLLDSDSEDHLGATQHLAPCYIALGEWEALQELLPDLDERTPHHALAAMWLALCYDHAAEQRARTALHRHSALCAELRRTEHPTDQAYLRDIGSDHPSREAEARELYLQYGPLWEQYPEVAEAMHNI